MILYKKNFSEQEKNNEALLLKLAFLSEKTNNYTDCLFYLSKLALINPSRRLFEKMDKLAEEQNIKGYEFDDYNYFIIFYRRYGDYIPILLLTLGTYIVVIMVTKSRRREPILQIHKISIVAYLLVLLGLLNVPSLYQTCIIVNENTFLRDEPSSASSVIERIGKGHKLTILGSVDHWNRVIWDNEIVYIRKSDALDI
ncbi:SH3 domain-containing protein [Dyadobacter flavalbus]|nr:SH3 domain-containing protein [Dyadobacter flavalbus]